MSKNLIYVKKNKFVLHFRREIKRYLEVVPACEGRYYFFIPLKSYI